MCHAAHSISHCVGARRKHLLRHTHTHTIWALWCLCAPPRLGLARWLQITTHTRPRASPQRALSRIAFCARIHPQSTNHPPTHKSPGRVENFRWFGAFRRARTHARRHRDSVREVQPSSRHPHALSCRYERIRCTCSLGEPENVRRSTRRAIPKKRRSAYGCAIV